MSEFEDRLNSILSSPEDMKRIIGLAKSLSGAQNAQENREQNGEKHASQQEEEQSNAWDFGDIDPKLMGVLSRLMREYSAGQPEKFELLAAIRPYLRKERRDNMDRAVKIARLAHVAKLALSEFPGGEFHI